MDRNDGLNCSGMGARIAPEWLPELERNTQSAGIITIRMR